MSQKKLTAVELKVLTVDSIGKYLKDISLSAENTFYILNHFDKPEKIKAEKIEVY